MPMPGFGSMAFQGGEGWALKGAFCETKPFGPGPEGVSRNLVLARFFCVWGPARMGRRLRQGRQPFGGERY